VSPRETTPRGKIGRMSEALREQINRMLRDNRPADEIMAFCDANGFPGISPQNVSNWKANGFAKWLRRQERLDAMNDRREFALELARQAREGGIDGVSLASDAASALAIDQITEALEGFDGAELQGLMAEKPQHFFDLVGALSKIRLRDQAGQLVSAKLADMRRLADEAAKAAVGNGDMSKIAEEMKRVLGA
jgi:hypothetical protein